MKFPFGVTPPFCAAGCLSSQATPLYPSPAPIFISFPDPSQFWKLVALDLSSPEEKAGPGQVQCKDKEGTHFHLPGDTVPWCLLNHLSQKYESCHLKAILKVCLSFYKRRNFKNQGNFPVSVASWNLGTFLSSIPLKTDSQKLTEKESQLLSPSILFLLNFNCSTPLRTGSAL